MKMTKKGENSINTLPFYHEFSLSSWISLKIQNRPNYFKTRSQRASAPIYWRTPDLDGAVRTTDRRRKAWKNYEGEMTCKYTRHKATSGAATAASAATDGERERAENVGRHKHHCQARHTTEQNRDG